MKGVKKWTYTACLSSLALVLSVVISSLLGTENVSALSYNVNTVPIWYPSSVSSFPNYYQNDSGFYVRVSSSSPVLSSSRPFVISYNNIDNHCQPISSNSFHRLPYISGSSFLQYNYFFTGANIDFNSSFCNYLGSRDFFNAHYVATDTIGSGDWITLNSLSPYRYTYDGFYITGTKQDAHGLVRENSLNLVSDFFSSNELPDKILSYRIPIGSGKEYISDSFVNGQHIVIDGHLWFDVSHDEFVNDDVSYFSNTSVSTVVNYMSRSGDGYIGGDVHSCSTQWDFVGSSDDSNYSLYYTCTFSLRSSSGSSAWNTELYYPWFALEFNLDYDEHFTIHDISYLDSTLQTDVDSTFGGDFNDDISGADPDSAPGSALQHVDNSTDNVSWFDSLVNLFNFNILNPFAPIFALFTDNNSCVNIPTIAGMLNSSETQYCPWFDSTTRDIVTPVVGLSATMLLFGFFVHWLGSSSDAVFDDAGSLSPPGYVATGGTAIKKGWRVKRSKK